MNAFNGLVGLLKRKPKEKPLVITHSIDARLRNLGLSNTDLGYKHAARVLQNHSDQGYNVLKKWSESALKNNSGAAYYALNVYGLEKVDEVVKKYGEDSSEFLNGILEAEKDVGFEIVDKTHKRYGLCDIGRVAPIYNELMEARLKEEEKKQYEIKFIGEVQDVNFRSTSTSYATLCGINGSVRNQEDGSVLCQVQGTESLVNVFILALNKKFKISEVIKKEIELKERKLEYITS